MKRGGRAAPNIPKTPSPSLTSPKKRDLHGPPKMEPPNSAVPKVAGTGQPIEVLHTPKVAESTPAVALTSVLLLQGLGGGGVVGSSRVVFHGRAPPGGCFVAVHRVPVCFCAHRTCGHTAERTTRGIRPLASRDSGLWGSTSRPSDPVSGSSGTRGEGSTPQWPVPPPCPYTGLSKHSTGCVRTVGSFL